MRANHEQRAGAPVGPVLAAGRRHTVGIRRDGTVLAAGRPDAPECAVDEWQNVVAVAAGNVHAAPNTGRSHTAVLLAEGTVVSVG